MKVLLCQQHDFYQRVGGAETQFWGYVEGLRALGIDVQISMEKNPPLKGRGLDLVHIFNVCHWKESLAQAIFARHHGLPVFLSTIYWNSEEIWNERVRMRQVSHPVAVESYQASKESIRSLIEASDFLLPNSHAEFGVLAADALPTQPYWVVRNGVDPGVFMDPDLSLLPPLLHALDRPFVLTVGRVELRKNTLALVRALADLPVPLVIVGDIYPDGIDHHYALECKEAARRRPAPTIFLPRQKPAVLAAIYSRANVFALPSWFETPGLATMEAALFGCRCVVADRGAVREYFADQVIYCNPRDENSIREGVGQALQEFPYMGFAAHLFESRRYTWAAAAGDLMTAYRKGLEIWRCRDGGMDHH